MVFFCPASATEKTESQATPTAAGCVLQRPVASWTVLPFFRASAIWAPAAEPIGTSHGWVVGGSSAASVHAMTTAGIACASTPASPSRNRPPPRLPLPGSRTNTPRPSRHRLFLFARHLSPGIVFLLFHSRPDSLEQVLRLGNTRLASVRAYRRRNTHLATETRSVILDRDDPSSSKTPIPALPPGLDRRPTTCTKDRRLDDLRSDNPPPGVNAICA